MFSYDGANGPESSTALLCLDEIRQVAVPVRRQDNYVQCLVELIRMRYRERSLLSTIDLRDE